MKNYLTYSRYVEQKAKAIYIDPQSGDFSVAKLAALRNQAQENRQMEWDSQAEIGWRIRNNELPLQMDRKNFEKWKDKYFKDNWIVKGQKLKISYLIGGDIWFDLKRFDGNEIDDPVISPLENEGNFAWIHENGIMELVEVLFDLGYVGYGVSHTGYNPFKRTKFWNTGRISYEHVDSRDVWYLSNDGMCKKIFAIFYRSAVNTEDLKREYPAQAKEISEEQPDSKGSGINMKGQTYVWTCQVLHVFPFVKREIIDDAASQRFLYLEEEIKNFSKKLKEQYAGKTPPDETFITVFRKFQEMSNDTKQENFDAFIDSGAYMEDVYRMSNNTIRDDDDCWFQVLVTGNGVVLPQPTGMMVAQNKVETTPIKYIGDKSSFQFVAGIKRDKSSYPFGSAWFNSDMLELKTLLMTTLAILTMKANKPNLQYELGSLQNQSDFIEGWWRMDIPAIVDPEWRKDNKDLEPYKYKTAAFDKSAYMALDQMATETIKSQEGSVDALRGVQTSSQQSGTQTAQLQAAASTYQKIDELFVHYYLKTVGEAIFDLIVKYRRHRHLMPDYNEDGSTKQVLVNSSPDTTYGMDDYYVQPIVEPTPEVQKRIDQQNAENLYSKGLMHPLDYIKIMGIKNPEKTWERSQLFAQIQQVMAYIEEHPEVVQQAEQQGQLPEAQGQQKKEASEAETQI